MNNRIDNSPYLSTGDPKTSVETTMFRPGELGHVYITVDGKRYQKVQLENSTLTLTIAVKQICFWKDRANKVVTFDIADAEAGREGWNGVAGLLESGATVPTAGQYFWVLQEGNNVVGLATSGTWAAYDKVIAGAGSGRVDRVVAGTAATYTVIGTVGSSAPGAIANDADLTFDLMVASAL
jgi:hypothetical protein